MKNTIQFREKNVYGNEMRYPVCEQSKMFCQLSGSKTITDNMLRTLLQFGISAEQVI